MRARGVRKLATRAGVGHSGHLSAESLRNQHDAPAVDASGKVSHKLKYLFDLNGYIVLRNVLDEAEEGLSVAARDQIVGAYTEHLIRHRQAELVTDHRQHR